MTHSGKAGTMRLSYTALIQQASSKKRSTRLIFSVAAVYTIPRLHSPSNAHTKVEESPTQLSITAFLAQPSVPVANPSRLTKILEPEIMKSEACAQTARSSLLD